MPEMFRIRKEQAEAYGQELLEEFIERAVVHLRGELAEETKAFNDDELWLRIRQGIERAQGYGLTTEQQIITFTDATYLAGRDFDSDPQCVSARKLLADPTLSADAKATMLLLMLPLGRRDQ